MSTFLFMQGAAAIALVMESLTPIVGSLLTKTQRLPTLYQRIWAEGTAVHAPVTRCYFR